MLRNKDIFSNTVLFILFIVVLLLFTTFVSTPHSETLDQCIQTCKDKYPTTPTDPPPVATKIFPDLIVWEDTTDIGTGVYKGTAAIVFTTGWEGKVSAVTMNDEKAFHATSYKGRPVFRFLKTGLEYKRPLAFTIETTSGVYAYTIGSASPNPPSTGKSWTRNTYTSDGYISLRTSETGSFFGKSIRFEYQNGFKLTIPDTFQRYEKKPRVTIYRHGGPGKDQSTSHGGMGIWTKEAGNSKTVKIVRLTE